MADTLKRRLGPGLLTVYGVGVMVGAGIYVLTGAVAGEAGIWAPLSFLMAGLIAAPTALSYAELSGRIPEAAGEAAYIEKGLKSRAFSVFVGLAIVVTGTISAAAVLRGGVGYLGGIIDIDPTLAIIAIGAALTFVAILGALESLTLAAIFTAIEIAGLAMIIWAGSGAEPVPAYATPAQIHTAGLAAGAILAFFAFIGFEDIVNMAEEAHHPERTLPIAILASLVITTALYALVSWAAIRAVPVEALAASEQPLALVWQETQGGAARFLSGIAVFAALNGVLAQIVMASRVMFGLGRRSPMLAIFHHTLPRTGAPWLATVLIGGAVVLGAVALPVAQLAELTSTVLLAVFTLINLALIRLKRRAPEAPFRVPMAVPVLGLILSLGAFLMTIWESLS